MASIGEARMDLVIAKRFDTTDPLVVVVFWVVMVALGSAIGLAFGTSA